MCLAQPADTTKFDYHVDRQINPVTKREEETKVLNGRTLEWREVPGESFDAKFIIYYSNGNKKEEGFRREVSTFHWYVPDSVGLTGIFAVPSGVWHYYYPDGKDSATGKYAFEMIKKPGEFPGSPTFTTGEEVSCRSDLKDSTWRYYSREGKLLRTEKWEKGKLVQREDGLPAGAYFWITAYDEYDSTLLSASFYMKLDSGRVQLLEEKKLNPLSGRMEISEYSKGQLFRWYEEPTDSVDTRAVYYFPDGKKSEEGFMRKVVVYEVDSFVFYKDSISIVPRKRTAAQRELQPTRVGAWKFYYPDGRDSATGSFAYEMHQARYEMPLDSAKPGTFSATGWVMTITDGVYDGIWRYYSHAGELLYIEEWDKGTLLRRTEQH